MKNNGQEKVNTHAFFKIAFRNLGRHKIKTIITTTAICFSVFFFIFLDAWMLGRKIDSKRNIVNYETGSAKIYSKKYFEKRDELPLYEGFDNYLPILEKLDNNGYDTAPRAFFKGSLISTAIELPFLFVGVDPEREKQVFQYTEYLEKGSMPRKDQFEILLGTRGARDLKVDVGDSLNLVTTIDRKNEKGDIVHIYQIMHVKVCGLINSPNPRTNGKIGYLSLDILQDKQGLLLEGKISEICIRKKNAERDGLPDRNESPGRITDVLGEVLPDTLTVVGWQEDSKDFLAHAASETFASNLIILVMLFMSLLGIANTMLMSVLERTKEIGMLRALGMSNKEITILFMLEAGFIGLIGSIIGMMLGIMINFYMVPKGIDFTSYYETVDIETSGYRILGIYRSAWNWLSIILSVCVATLVSSFTALFPVKRGLKQSIVDALRFE